MGRVTAEADWLREMSDLVAGASFDTGAPSQAEAALLMRLAREHAAVCGGATCILRDLPGGPEACELAIELAGGALGEELDMPADPRAHSQIYLAALRTAAPAVSHCRRVEHSSGHCWFSGQGTTADLCGRVLTVSHLLAPR